MEQVQKVTATYVEQVDNTPFNVIEVEDKIFNEKGEETGAEKVFKIVMGNQVVSEKTFDEMASAKDYIYTKPWELIMAATAIYCDKIYKIYNENGKD